MCVLGGGVGLEKASSQELRRITKHGGTVCAQERISPEPLVLPLSSHPLLSTLSLSLQVLSPRTQTVFSQLSFPNLAKVGMRERAKQRIVHQVQSDPISRRLNALSRNRSSTHNCGFSVAMHYFAKLRERKGEVIHRCSDKE